MSNIQRLHDPADEAADLSVGDRRPAGTSDRRWLALAVLCLSLVLITLDNTVLNVALPTLVRDLRASTSQLQWIVHGYQLVFAGLLFTAGSMADRYGRKGMLSLGLVIFGVGTAASAVAGSASLLIATRAFMGVGGAMIMPSTLSILSTVFPDASERARAIAIWAAMGAVGIALGPVLGGLLLAHFGWGSIFAINIPVVIVALIAGHFLLPHSKDPAPARIDPIGSVLSIVTLVAMVFSVIEGPDKGWTSVTVLGAAAVAIAALVAFVAWESHCDHPMLDLKLFRDHRFTVGALSLTLLYFGALGTYFLYTQHLQFVLGYSALRAGVYSVPFAVVVVIASLKSPGIVRRFGTGPVTGVGLLILAASTALRATANAHTGYPLLLISLVIAAVGVGITIAPSTASIMVALPPAQAGVGSAINDASRQVGAAAGVAVLGSIWLSRYHHVLAGATLRTQVPAGALQASRSSVGAALAAARTLPAAPRGDLVGAAKAAFVHGSNVANVVAAVVAVAAALIAFRYLPNPRRSVSAAPPTEAAAEPAPEAVFEEAAALSA